MCKKIFALLMCLAIAVTGAAFAEKATTEVVLDHFTLKVGKIKKSGDKFVIDFTAYFDDQDLMRRYFFTFFPFFFPEDGSEILLADTEGVIKDYDNFNSLGYINNMCYLNFLTADGKPFIHPSKDSDMMQIGGGQLLDGRWYKPFTLTTHTLYPKEKGVNVELHVLNQSQPYPSEETVTMLFISFDE